ncbi:hypothetical protein QBC40DRAFT_174240 [Triangularia verruculosa]|uniref:Uncharacterized protein n=1 Tax=Triangularia verruculosa TaxID=2587418 RepID=A0AAN6XKR5_9PEZI|nr:hypothetical protein QBC40DRAFT_174240 [Triangularia verruculosa]
MDVVSPYSKISTTTATGLETKKQPTYTTVGSIYNPSAATPIQPPTRRPRARRFPQHLEPPSGEGFNLPDSLSSLLSKERSPPSPPTTANTLDTKQYTPLQQNYDRALSPIHEQEFAAFSDLGMTAPTLRSGNLPHPPSVLEDDESVASEDTLVSSKMTVRSLRNLASYPNPMRKAAQKALAKARPANLSFSRPGGLSPLSITASDIGPGRDRPTAATAGLPSAVSSGPPQPLTAGPPGLRQLKRAAFDSTTASIRNSRFEGQNEPRFTSAHMPIGHQPRASTVAQPYKAEADNHAIYDREVRGRDIGLSSHLSQHDFADIYGPVTQMSRPSSDLRQSSSSTPFYVAGPSVKRFVYDTLPPEKISRYFPDGFPSNYDGRYTPLSDAWHKVAIPSHTPPLDEEAQKQRESVLAKDLDQERDAQTSGRLQRKLGAIGAERERLFGCAINKPVQSKLSMEEAIQMESSEHVEPLLNMTYAALLNYRDYRRSCCRPNGWFPKFAEPDESLIDRSPEGNNSFFDDPRAEAPKKKKVTRVPRRLGY